MGRSNLPATSSGFNADDQEIIDLVTPLMQYMVDINDTYMRFRFPRGVLSHEIRIRQLTRLFKEITIDLDDYRYGGGLNPGDAATYTFYFRSRTTLPGPPPASGLLPA